MDQTHTVAERRYLTVLFSDLSDSARLTRTVHNEEYAALTVQLNRSYKRIVEKHGGLICQIRGDGFLAIFGLESREDEGRRATSAALELHEAIRQLAFTSVTAGKLELRMHSGIHAGLVLLVEGDEVQGRYLIVGDAANLASRLSDEAEPDEILVSRVSLGDDLHFFDVGPERLMELKGRETPLPAHAVLGDAGITRRYDARRRRGLAPLFGRERELQELQQAVDEFGTDAANVLTVLGEPGIGKTRLIEEFLAKREDAGAPVLRGFCESYLNAEPLQPILHILRSVFAPAFNKGEFRSDRLQQSLQELGVSDRHASVLLRLLGGSLEDTPPQSTIESAFGAVLGGLAIGGPVVLFIDDWQWVDDATRRIVGNLSHDPSVPVVWLRSSRVEEHESHGNRLLPLGPLQTEQCERLIGALRPSADSFVVDRIRAASGGNPLYVEELCHSRTRLDPDVSGLPDPERVTNYLNMLIESRVSRLDAAQTRLLQTAAVIGIQVPLWLLKAASDDPVTEAKIGALADLDLLFRGDAKGVLRFKHGITREVVFESIRLDERRALHRRIAQTIKGRFGESAREDHLETLAYHYGETLEFAPAAAYAEQAGDKAMRVAALDRACQQYLAALQALDRVDQGDDVYRRWMSIAHRLGMASLYDASAAYIDIFRRAVARATEREDRKNLFTAEYRLAFMVYALGNHRDAVFHGRRALADVAALNDPKMQTQLEATMGIILGGACNYTESMGYLDKALAVQAPYKNNQNLSTAYAYSLAAKAMVVGDQGDFNAAYDCLDEAEQVIRQHRTQQIHMSVNSMRSGVLLWQGRLEDARDCAHETARMGNRFGSQYMTGIGTVISLCAAAQLDSDKLDMAIQACSQLQGIEQALWVAVPYARLTTLLAAAGRYTDARHFAARTLARSRKLESVGDSEIWRAVATLPATHRHLASTEYLERARISAEKRQSRRDKALNGLAALELGLVVGPERQALMQACERELSAMGMQSYLARAERLLHPA